MLRSVELWLTKLPRFLGGNCQNASINNVGGRAGTLCPIHRIRQKICQKLFKNPSNNLSKDLTKLPLFLGGNCQNASINNVGGRAGKLWPIHTKKFDETSMNSLKVHDGRC